MESISTSLRIIADDLGLHPSINEGIFFLLKNNHIHGASVMVNGEAFEDAVSKIIEMNLQSQIGIHIVLVEEKSLTGTQFPKNHKTFFIKYILGLIKKNDIKKEIDAQVKKYISSGIRPQFLNSHQHLHLLPGIMNMVIETAKENGIKYIRLVNEPIHGKGKIFRKIQLLFLKFLSGLAKRKLNKAGLESNDVFVGFISAGNLKESDIQFTKQIRKGLVELGCHPGFEDENLRKKYKNWGDYNWQNELGTLSRHK